ncbi:MAG: 4-phosphoerythronate dehydrogenase [Rhodothermales bacterium]|nr:4-phosphoerythronate dehydrogenase [Rhodothermales bacterium]MDG2016352.1 4-phosphoerythronate dehydrogenase [Rhodothermales bacterium]
MMHIVADAHIPFVEDIFSALGNVVLIAGHEIDRESVKTADVLIVRSITPINEELLGDSSVKFVGSATAGLDHVDQLFLQEKGIHFASAPGANADSVVEYVFAALAELSIRFRTHFVDKTIGIVGCGNVGHRLADTCRSLGMRVIENDPPRGEREKGFVDLNTLLRQSDIVSVHTPLASEGPYATRGLIGEAQLALMKEDSWLIQSSRGGVCDETAMIDAREGNRIGALVLDVWEGEPKVNGLHIDKTDIATGHIAGYSIDAKKKGVEMVLDGARRAFGLPMIQHQDPTGLPSRRHVSPGSELLEALRHLYDIRKDDHRFRKVMNAADIEKGFHAYRATYPMRRSFDFNWAYLSNPNERS